MMKMIESGLKFGRTWVDRIMGKVDKDQGVANAGKYLGVGEDGNVTLKEIVIPEGRAYTIKSATGTTSSPAFKTNATMITVDNTEGYLFTVNFKNTNLIVNVDLEYVQIGGTIYYPNKIKTSGSTGTTLSDLGVYYYAEVGGSTISVAVWVPTDALGEATAISVSCRFTQCYLEEA